MESPEAATAPQDTIVCRVTPWYYRRMGLLGGMLLIMGLYFLYDGKFGYPKANAIAAQRDWFEKELLPGFDAAKAQGTLDAWIEQAKAKGWPTGRNGEPPRWVAYAAQHGWPEKPEKYTDREITEQFYWGGGTLLVALIVGILVLISRNKVLRCAADHWVTPEGSKIQFADVFRVDKRKWDNKGLAYAWYREGGQGPERKAVIDDLKFNGAAQVLDRLLAVFKGELIEKVAESGEGPGEDAPTPGEKPLPPQG